MHILKQATAVLVTSLVVVNPLFAQQRHILTRSALDDLARTHDANRQADRTVVNRVLSHPAVADVAAQLGLEIGMAQAAVATLSEAELSRLAQQAQQVERHLSGGANTITLSTTTIIIGLLLLILIIVAVN